jgi:hypothetical protein
VYKFAKNIRGHLEFLGTKWVTSSQFLIENTKQKASPYKIWPPRWTGGRDLCIPAHWFIIVFRNAPHQTQSCASLVQFTHVRSIFMHYACGSTVQPYKFTAVRKPRILHSVIGLCGTMLWTPSQNSKLQNRLSEATTIPFSVSMSTDGTSHVREMSPPIATWGKAMSTTEHNEYDRQCMCSTTLKRVR